MKDFRVYREDSNPPQGPIIGGSPYSLPDIVTPATHIARGLSLMGVSLLLRPWRILAVLPGRRGGLLGAVFSWGRLLSILLALFLVAAPTLVYNGMPNWREVALFCFIISGLSVISAIYRCCGGALSCAFWVVITLYLGENALNTQPVKVAGSKPPVVARVAASTIEGEWEDLVSGKPVAIQQVALAHKRAVRAEELPSLSGGVASVSDSVSNIQSLASNFLHRSTQSANASISNAIAIPGSMVGGALAGVGLDVASGGALPEDAYFGGASKVGSMAEAFADGGGNPIDGIVASVGEYLGR